MRHVAIAMLLPLLLVIGTNAKPDCASGYVVYAPDPILDGAAAVPLVLYVIPPVGGIILEPTCDKFQVVSANSFNNQKKGFINFAASIQVQNVGTTPGDIVFTPIFSKAIAPAASMKVTVAAGASDVVTITDAIRLETDEVTTIQVKALGSNFLVGGGLSSLLVSRINEPLDP